MTCSDRLRVGKSDAPVPPAVTIRLNLMGFLDAFKAVAGYRLRGRRQLTTCSDIA